MSKQILEKMQKWHTFCSLKGINIEENFYSIIHIMELIDQLQSEIEDNNSFYQAALESRRMQINRNNIEWYREHLNEVYQEKEYARQEQDEINNLVLKSLRDNNEFKFSVEQSDKVKSSIVLSKANESLSINISVIKNTHWRYADRWEISYSWFDKGISKTQIIKWEPKISSLKCPGWFPDHWKTSKNISETDHVAFFVAWKLVNGKGKQMGGTPRHTKASRELEPIKDLIEMIAD